MITIGVDLGGPELKDSSIDVVLGRCMSAAMRAREIDYKNGTDGWLNAIFIVPGSISKPDFQGYKLGYFSRNEKGLVVQIEVPEAVVNAEDAKEFAGSSLRRAVGLASEFFTSRRIPFSTLKAEKIITAVEAAL